MRKLIQISILIFVFSLTAHGQKNNDDQSNENRWQQFRVEQGENWKIRWRNDTGVPLMISGGLTNAYQGSPKEIAISFLREHHELFLMTSDLSDLTYFETLNSGRVNHVTFKQKYRGLPIEGASYKVHVRSTGQVDMANGHYYPDINVSTTPTISKVQSIDITLSDLELPDSIATHRLDRSAELIVYLEGDNKYKLAYKTQINGNNPAFAWRYIIDANSSAILDKQNLLMQITGTGKVYPKHPNNSSLTVVNLYRLEGNGYLDGEYVEVFNEDSSEAYSSSDDFQYSTSSTHFDEVSVYYHVDGFRNDYIEDLIDDTGNNISFTKINAHAHAFSIALGSNNAWFNRTTGELHFGDGPGTGYSSFAREDKVAYHEYSHAVIYDIEDGISSADPDEEGAISEGLPDFFAGSFS